MLLETLDIKKNDIIIYSQNIFNLEKNFKIIFKDDFERRPRKITFSEVCNFVEEFTPKNLIVYRLLTNIEDFALDRSKYGFFISINSESELVYFDPIFAVKELEDYIDKIDEYDLRFRIQQVGLTTLNRVNNRTNFAEIYSIDLEAIEAKFQNDKVFAEAIFSFLQRESSGVINNAGAKKADTKPKHITRTNNITPKIVKPLNNRGDAKPEHISEDAEHKEGIKIISHDISEDRDFDYKQILKMNFKKRPKIEDENLSKTENEISAEKRKNVKSPTIVPKLVKPEPENNKSSLGEFLNKKKNEAKSSDIGKSTGAERPLVDIFKSSTPFNEFVEDRENKQVVLRLKKK